MELELLIGLALGNGITNIFIGRYVDFGTWKECIATGVLSFIFVVIFGALFLK